MLELIDPLISWVQENIVLIGATLVGVLVVGYLLVRVVVVGAARWRFNRYKHHGGSRRWWPIYHPRIWLSWFKLQSWVLFKARLGMLASPALREFYAPVKLYTDERETNRIYVRAAWLSPFEKSARASISQNKAVIKGKHFRVRKQLADASKHMFVRPLPASIPVAGDRSQHFQVVLDLNRQKRTDIIALSENILSAVEGESIEVYEKGRTNNSETFIVHMVEPESILTAIAVPGEEFFKENPAEKWDSMPMMVDEFGSVLSLPTCHTLVFGMPGSGKSSPINGTVVQAIPYVQRGEAELWGIDKKESELLSWEFSSLFEDIVYTTEEAMENIAQLHERLLTRNREKRRYLNFEKGKVDLQRKMPASKRHPMVLILIDELLSLLLDLQTKGAEGKASMGKLAMIMALGRSCGFHVYGATQAIDKEILGRLRECFLSVVVFHNKASVGLNEVVLGEGAIERGFDPRKIGDSNSANGYKTSGIGFIMGESGDPVLGRFAHLDDEAIADYVRAYPNEAKLATLSSPAELEKMMEESSNREVVDVNERIAALTTAERNDFLESLKVFGSSADVDDLEDDGEFTIEEVS